MVFVCMLLALFCFLVSVCLVQMRKIFMARYDVVPKLQDALCELELVRSEFDKVREQNLLLVDQRAEAWAENAKVRERLGVYERMLRKLQGGETNLPLT